jgi:hypothetical protein
VNKGMRHLIFCLLIGASAFSIASEKWAWNTTVTSLKTFGGNNGTWVCVNLSNVDRPLCFSEDDSTYNEKFSILLAAKLAGSTLDVSYRTDSERYAPVWFDNYRAWHVWL